MMGDATTFRKMLHPPHMPRSYLEVPSSLRLFSIENCIQQNTYQEPAPKPASPVANVDIFSEFQRNAFRSNNDTSPSTRAHHSLSDASMENQRQPTTNVTPPRPAQPDGTERLDALASVAAHLTGGGSTPIFTVPAAQRDPEQLATHLSRTESLVNRKVTTIQEADHDRWIALTMGDTTTSRWSHLYGPIWVDDFTERSLGCGKALIGGPIVGGIED
ncbi:uncharacterized protein EI90DRAFT_3053787 [Cantharellus anzutake]|uniref:uncharacterized protein n=1 Tax=Cantharellus anzutake TaxID=1750568 RepID=UPI001903C02C|nr:uncharacterized protein EI90DRAFT_3053787 [Cantharellus anzutake]KAF8332622.1 hypothetical protein EI90DRAFT_3053787 [Cantharellus anzutake]